MYADFQEKKTFADISGKKFQTFHCSNVTTMISLGCFPKIPAKLFSLKLAYIHIQKTSPTYVASYLSRQELCLPSKSLYFVVLY